MSSQIEKQSFSLRLKQALGDSGHPISPTYLANEFNNRYDGQPISVQSANNWLLGKAIPNQDKLSILSIWLNVSSQWLRFGEDVHSTATTSACDFSKSDLKFLIQLNKLSPKQKELIFALMNEFSH